MTTSTLSKWTETNAADHRKAYETALGDIASGKKLTSKRSDELRQAMQVLGYTDRQVDDDVAEILQLPHLENHRGMFETEAEYLVELTRLKDAVDAADQALKDSKSKLKTCQHDRTAWGQARAKAKAIRSRFPHLFRKDSAE